MVVGLGGALASFSANWFISANTMSVMSCLSSAWCSPTRGMEEPATCPTRRMVIAEREGEDANTTERCTLSLYKICHINFGGYTEICDLKEQATFVL